MLAVFSSSAATRGEAVAILRRRDVREFADFLIGLVQQPIEFEVKQVSGPGSSGELLIKGQGSKPNLRRVYSPPAGPEVPLQPGDSLVYDASGMPVIRRPVVGSSLRTWACMIQTGCGSVSSLNLECGETRRSMRHRNNGSWR